MLRNAVKKSRYTDIRHMTGRVTSPCHYLIFRRLAKCLLWNRSCANELVTHPGDLLLGINLVILRGRGEVQVALAISSSYAHAVYLVLAGATIQTEKKEQNS